MLLYRPTGLKELELIAESGFREYPSRLDWQPIFYPVLNFDYAAQIARTWNARDKFAGYCGFVTRFEIDDEFVRRYEVHTVGAHVHQELWVPAEELLEFNAHIVGRITVEAVYYGDAFEGELDPASNLPVQIARLIGF